MAGDDTPEVTTSIEALKRSVDEHADKLNQLALKPRRPVRDGLDKWKDWVQVLSPILISLFLPLAAQQLGLFSHKEDLKATETEKKADREQQLMLKQFEFAEKILATKADPGNAPARRWAQAVITGDHTYVVPDTAFSKLALSGSDKSKTVKDKAGTKATETSALPE